MENKEFKPTLDFITEKECEIKVFCNHSNQVDALLQIYPKLYSDIFSYKPEYIKSYFEQHLFDLDDDDDDKIYYHPDSEFEGSDLEGFYDSCFSNGYNLLIGLYVRNGKIKDWYWDKVKQRKRDISIHTEKYSMKFSQFKSLLFNTSSINDNNNDTYINMKFFELFNNDDSCFVYCDNDEQVQTLLKKYPILYPDIFLYNDGHLFHKSVVDYIENMETDDPNYEYYDFDSFYKSCFTDGYKLVIELIVKHCEFVDWAWSKSHIDSMELFDCTFDNFNDSLFKKGK